MGPQRPRRSGRFEQLHSRIRRACVAAVLTLCSLTSGAGAHEEAADLGAGRPEWSLLGADAPLALFPDADPIRMDGWRSRAGDLPVWTDASGDRISLLSAQDRALTTTGLEYPVAIGRDWAGIARDTGFFLAYQFAAVAIAYPLPSSVTNWYNKDASFENWWDNVRNPHWDEDDPFTNYVLHPYWGATYYIRARERGFARVDSFLYSALLSTLYEFGAESLFEPPSYQDLIVTPVAGSLVGAFVFEPIREWVKAKPELKWYDHAILISTDPLGALNSVFERLLGIKTTIRVRFTPPVDGAPVESTAGRPVRERNPHVTGFGLSISGAWP